jgi:hypothetical protein
VEVETVAEAEDILMIINISEKSLSCFWGIRLFREKNNILYWGKFRNI